jgi:hypothetical protein
MKPPANMPVGNYVVSCTAASREEFGKGWRIVIDYRIIEGEYAGVALHQWIAASGQISDNGRYAKQCEVALGRALDVNDDINYPASIFSGRHFTAFVGFRKTDGPRGGKITDLDNYKRRKDKNDGLRVHELLSLVEL